MSRSFLLALAAAAALAAPAAHAHPLGNLSLNHQTYVSVSRDRVDLLYVLDEAEFVTLRDRNLGPPARILELKRAYILSELSLTADGRPVALRPRPGAKISFPPGQAGLATTRIELPLRAKVKAPRRVEVRDSTFPDTKGWVGFVARPGRGTTVRTGVTKADPTRGLRTYRGVDLSAVPSRRVATFAVRPGPGTLIAPSTDVTAKAPKSSEDDGFAAVFEDAASGSGLFVVLLLAAFAWGAFHALSPGHGKAMVAAYLVGTRGTARHAVALGGIVTLTHTIGVFALGLVTLLLTQFILPEHLYPWLNLAAGLLIVAVGLGVLRSRIRWARERRRQAHPSDEPPPGPDSHEGGLLGSGEHRHEHGHDHHHHGHSGHGDEGHHHRHDVPEVTWRGLAGIGVSAGLIPCPSALVVLLAAVSQHKIGLGLLLIVVFSAGLACTLAALGLIVVSAKRLAARAGSRFSFAGRLSSALPALSTLLILGLGIVLTAKAVPDVL